MATVFLPKRFRIPGILLCLAVVALAGCSGGSFSDPFTSGAFAVKNIAFNSGETESAFDANTRTYTFRSFSIAGPAPRATIDATGVKRVLVNGTERPLAADQPLTVESLAPGTRVEISLQGGDGGAATYTFKLVPDDLPAYTATAFQPTPGRVLVTTLPLLNPQQRSFLLLMNGNGKLLGFRSSDLPVADFQIQRTASGAERFTYCAFDRLIFTVKHSTATCHVLDQGLRRIADANARKSAGNPDGVTGHHEVVLIEDNHYLLTAYVTKLVSNIPASLQAGNPGPRKVVTSLIQEVKDGAVVFEWDGSRHSEFYTSAVIDNDFASLDGLPEYMHLNAIAVDSDGNLLASFRHTSQILKIHRTTGDVLWRLGGRNSDFPLTPAQVFSAQHHVRRLPDGTLSLYDNGNQNVPPVSRALSFRLDESRKAVTEFRAVTYQGTYSSAMGSAQYPAADRVFIGWGFRASPDYEDVTELVASTGQAVFSLKFLDRALFSYRALKYPN